MPSARTEKHPGPGYIYDVASGCLIEVPAATAAGSAQERTSLRLIEVLVVTSSESSW
ncbi:hypothetical protein [Cryobacterium lyxosi]|uniref:hypothetical protein n=1 Tax=Cryobacterium lyxosi TaxID=1259228 RepID=UPI0018E0A4F7|nr:hypothetical protein [Cryobacterium lyxosi]